jgi:hypothetical protein
MNKGLNDRIHFLGQGDNLVFFLVNKQEYGGSKKRSNFPMGTELISTRVRTHDPSDFPSH